MTAEELAGFGATINDIGLVVSPGTGERRAAFLPDGAVLYGVTRYTVNGEQRLAADMGLLTDLDGFQTTTDANGNIEIRAESGAASFEITDPNGMAVDLAAGDYVAVYGGEVPIQSR